MGALRLWLALIVVLGHMSLPIPGSISASEAVTCFFVMSGFYIGRALRGRYASSPGRFFLNRFLRLWPSYVVVALASFFYWVLITTVNSNAHSVLSVRLFLYPEAITLSFLEKVYVVFQDLFIFGSDWGIFLYYQPPGQLVFSPHAWHMQSEGLFPLSLITLVPQAWSLGIELTLYVLAWRLLRWRSWQLAAIALTVLLAKFICQTNTVAWGPWSNRFFLFELGCFLAGALAERSKAGLAKRPQLLLLGLLWILFSGFLPLSMAARQLILAFITALMLPQLDQRSSRWSWDAFLARLSYPLYVVHYFVIQALPLFMHAAGFRGFSPPWGAVLLILALFLAALTLERLVERPMERVRQKVRGGRVVAV